MKLQIKSAKETRFLEGARKTSKNRYDDIDSEIPVAD